MTLYGGAWRSGEIVYLNLNSGTNLSLTAAADPRVTFEQKALWISESVRTQAKSHNSASKGTTFYSQPNHYTD